MTSTVYTRVKRLIDVSVASAALMTGAPILAVIALAVKLDSRGPILFRQRRLGKDGAIFDILKFRTMNEGASVVIGEDHTVVNPVGDFRVTRVGRLLRLTSLDELPQLLNVLKGDMSLVGPRPDLPEGLAVYDQRQKRKLEVKPGLTGLAQVSGRNRLGAEEKWELDVQYVEQQSAALDVRILLGTLVGVLRREGIYKE